VVREKIIEEEILIKIYTAQGLCSNNGHLELFERLFLGVILWKNA